MAFKNLLYILCIVLFFHGCSYRLVDTQRLDSIDSRLTHLEEKALYDTSKELEAALNEHDERLQSFVQKSFQEQNATFQSLNTELKSLTTLIKSKNRKTVKRKTKPKTVNKIVAKEIKKLVVGSVEKVQIYPSNLIMNARIDTGAETSSINASDITEFERDGKKWVGFTLVDEKTNTPYSMERKVVRRVKILQSSLEEGFEKRVVVTLKVTIGDKEELSEFTLTSREHMRYPILIGRNVLQDLIVVDVSEQYMAPLVAKRDDKFKK